MIRSPPFVHQNQQTGETVSVCILSI